ncbi:hypothetical protein CPB97_011177 [Podila verticillata]|nr:hypothetical protein CPB97_011177 [Podila verticillata]
MSGFYPQCVTSNQYATYAVSTMYIRDRTHLVVIKSVNNPTSSFNAAWEVIAISSIDDVDPNNPNPLQTLISDQCSVDNDGTFSMWARKNDNFYNFKFDRSSQGKVSTSNQCKKNIPRGEWTKTQLVMPVNLVYKRWVSVQDPSSTAGAATVVVHTRVEEALPPVAPPTIQYAPINTTSVQTFVSNQDLRPIVLTNTSAAIINLVYGDNQMFALLKSGAPIPVPDEPYTPPKGRVTYNQTLTYFPFPPKNQADVPQVVSVPWNVDCKDSELWDENYAKVANGKLYYMCKVRIYPSFRFVTPFIQASNNLTAPLNLHIYDTKTSQTKSLQLGSSNPGLITLTYGPSSKTDPQFITVFRYGSSSLTFDLFKNETEPSMVYGHFSFMPNTYEINEMCEALEDGRTLWENIGIAIGTLVGVVLLVWGWRRWRNERKAPKPTVEEDGLPVYDQSPVSGQNHIELAEMQRPSEEGREGEAPPGYAPRS